ncbi:MAG: sugar ABC transporter permease [Firmicutes bacterium]|nr:sugar ABC transporter permease [Bacillota bacterium]
MGNELTDDLLKDKLLGIKKAPVKKNSFLSRQQNIWGWLLITPAVLGLTIWVAFPLGVSLITSLMRWDMIMPPRYIGFQNYLDLSRDPLFWQAVRVTMTYTLIGVPAQILAAFLAALLLNSKVRGMRIFRTLFYVPSLIPVAVSCALWLWLYNQQFGLFNLILEWLGLPGQLWVFGPQSVIPSLILMSLWGIGSTIIIFLAGLQGIPAELMEAVAIDGGKARHRLFHIILPLTSPVIFYNIVIGIIGGLQTFTQPYLMTNGGPANSSLFYVLQLYRQAFMFSKMGTACAMAWVLFIVTAVISALVFKSSSLWVYYEGEAKK